jgi:hypothetical protein
MVFRDGEEWKLMCPACYEAAKKTWKNFKIRVVYDTWMYDDAAETAIFAVKDDPHRDDVQKGQVEVIETKEIVWTSDWDSVYERAKLALEAGDPVKALEILKSM